MNKFIVTVFAALFCLSQAAVMVPTHLTSVSHQTGCTYESDVTSMTLDATCMCPGSSSGQAIAFSQDQSAYLNCVDAGFSAACGPDFSDQTSQIKEGCCSENGGTPLIISDRFVACTF